MKLAVVRLMLAATALVLGSGCDLVASNRYDPNTPVEQQARAVIRGAVLTVLADGTEKAVDGATVELAAEGFPALTPVATDAEGSFSFGDLPPTTYRISARHPAYFRASADVQTFPGAEIPLELVLLPLPQGASDDVAHITGVVEKSGEQLLPAEEQDHSGILVEVADVDVRTVTNRAGAFDLFLAPGTYDVVFYAPDYNEARRDGVEAVAGETVTVPDSPVVLEPNPGRIAGTIRLEGVAGDTGHGDVLVSVPGGTTATTAPDGSYLLAGLAAGTYAVSAFKEGHDSARLDGVVVQGGRETLASEVHLAISRGGVRGVVELSGRADHSGVTVELTGTTHTAQTNIAGQFAIGSVPVGTYEVTARKDGFVRVAVGSVEVLPATDADTGTLTLVAQQGDFDINGGALYTNDPVVTLSLASLNAADMRLSEDASFTGADWVPFTAAPPFSLSSGDGTKTVYVQYRDANDVESGVFSSTIVLDTTPPSNAAVAINLDAAFTNNADGIVTLYFTATDATSGVRDVRVSNDGTFDTEVWQPFVDARTHTLGAPTSDGLKTVAVHYRDAAGNETATPASAAITVDRAPPTLSSFTIDCGGQADAAVCGSVHVTLALDATGATRMALSNDAGFAVEIFEPYATARAWFLTPGDGTKQVHVKLMDEAGNKTDAILDEIVLDTTAPEAGTLTLAGGAAWTGVALVALALASNEAGLRVALSGDLSSPGTYDLASVPATLTLTGGDGTRTVTARLIDTAGNRSDAFSDAVSLDTQPPQVLSVRVGDGSGYVRSADGSTSVEVTCSDALVADGALSLLLEDQAGAGLYDGAYVQVATVSVGTTQGPKSVTATCADPAGNSTASTPEAFVHDFAAPSISSFTVAAQGGGARTRDPRVTFSFVLADAAAGGAVAAVNDAVLDCATARYDYGATGTNVSFTLSAGDGARSLYLCARDAAGNTSAAAVATSNTVELDTAGPETPGLVRTDLSDASASVAWTTPAAADLASFVLERRLQDEGLFTPLPVALGAAATSYTDAVAESELGKARFYRIKARDDLGNASAYSIELNVGVPFSPVVDLRYLTTAAPAQRELLWKLPAGVALALGSYVYESADGIVVESALAANTTRYQLDATGVRANERLLLRTSNADLSLTWESEFSFGTTREVADSSPSAGVYTSLAVDGDGVAHIAYYDADSSTRDLKYLRADGASVPETLDSGGTVGLFTSLALDAAGVPHIAYWNQTQGDLMYLKKDGVSTPQTLASTGDTGRHPSIAMDSGDVPHIVFYDFTTKELLYLKVDGVSTPQVLDTVGNGGYSSLVLDENDVPRVAYFRDGFPDELRYLVIDGVSTPQTVEATGLTGEQGVSMALDGTGIAHVAWYDGTPADLRYKKLDGVALVQTLDSDGATGSYPSIAVDDNGVPHVIYQDRDNQSLEYVVVNAAPAPVTLDSLGNTGRFGALDVDKDGNLHVSYYNGNLNYLVLRRPVEPRVVDGETERVGDYSSIALDQDDVPHISYFRLGAVSADQNLKYVKLDATPSPQIVDASSSAGRFTSIAVDSTGVPHITYEVGSDLYYLVVDGVSTPQLLDGNDGNYTSMVLDDADVPHVVWFNDFGDQVRYLKVDGVSTAQIVESGLSVRSEPDIALDSAGVPHVVYYSWDLGLLRYAVLDGVSSPITLDDDGDVGDYASIAIDADDVPHIAYYDATHGALKYLRLDGVSVPEVIDDSGHVGQDTDIVVDAAGIPHITYEDVARANLKYLRLDGLSVPQVIDDTQFTGSLGTSIALDSRGQPHVSYCECHDNSSDFDLRYVRGPFASDLTAVRVEKQ